MPNGLLTLVWWIQVCVPPGALPHSVALFGQGPVREVKCGQDVGSLSDGIGVLIRRDARRLPLFLCTCRERPHEDPARGWWGLHIRTPPRWHLILGFRLLRLWEINLSYLSHPTWIDWHNPHMKDHDYFKLSTFETKLLVSSQSQFLHTDF